MLRSWRSCSKFYHKLLIFLNSKNIPHLRGLEHKNMYVYIYLIYFWYTWNPGKIFFSLVNFLESFICFREIVESMNKIKKDFPSFFSSFYWRKVAIYAFLSHNFIIIKFIWVSKESFKKIKVFRWRKKIWKERLRSFFYLLELVFIPLCSFWFFETLFFCLPYFLWSSCTAMNEEILWCIWKNRKQRKMCIEFYQQRHWMPFPHCCW